MVPLRRIFPEYCYQQKGGQIVVVLEDIIQELRRESPEEYPERRYDDVIWRVGDPYVVLLLLS